MTSRSLRAPARPTSGNRRVAESASFDWRALGRGVWRVVRNVLYTLAVAATAAGITYSVMNGLRWARETKDFALAQVVVTGNHALAESDIRALAGLTDGANIVAADIDRIARDIAKNPWVESVRVRRKLPDTLEVELIEHVAHGAVLLESVYLFDAQGVPFKALDAGETPAWPVVTGYSRDDYRVDPRAVQAGLLRARGVLGACDAAGLTKLAPLAEINAGRDGRYALVTRDDGAVLQFAALPSDDDLARAMRVLNELANRGEVADSILLGHGRRRDRAVVKLRNL